MQQRIGKFMGLTGRESWLQSKTLPLLGKIQNKIFEPHGKPVSLGVDNHVYSEWDRLMKKTMSETLRREYFTHERSSRGQKTNKVPIIFAPRKKQNNQGQTE